MVENAGGDRKKEDGKYTFQRWQEIILIITLRIETDVLKYITSPVFQNDFIFIRFQNDWLRDSKGSQFC